MLKSLNSFFLLIFILLLCSNINNGIFAQSRIGPHTFSDGAQKNKDTSRIIMGTIGQTSIAQNINGSLQKMAKIGFWYLYKPKPITEVIEIKKEDSNIFSFVLIGENPVINRTQVKCDLKIDTEMTINLVDIKGKVWETLAEGFHSSGSYIFEIDANKLISGLYFVNIYVGQLEKSISIIVQK